MTALTGISVTVTNVGNGQAGAFVVSITLRGNLQFPSLAPGESATVMFNCVENVMAMVDPTTGLRVERDQQRRLVREHLHRLTRPLRPRWCDSETRPSCRTRRSRAEKRVGAHQT